MGKVNVDYSLTLIVTDKLGSFQNESCYSYSGLISMKLYMHVMDIAKDQYTKFGCPILRNSKTRPIICMPAM